MASRSRRFWLGLVACVWLFAIAAGLRHLRAYAYQPGAAGTAQADWPMASAITRDTDKPTLVMFVHPMCPCSKASAHELARVIAKCDGQLNVQIVAIHGENAPVTFNDSQLITDLRAMPGVNVTIDRGGAEAKRFGARTSGHTFLYDQAGRLKFNGGLTAARGHEGDNTGSSAITALVRGQNIDAQHTRVFGCALLNESNAD